MATDLAKNDKNLREPCNPEEPLKSLYKRLNECVDYTTAAGEPISEVQFVHIAYGLVAETGQFQGDCRTWRAKLEPEKICTKSQAYFIEAQTDLHRLQQTSCQGRYVTGTAHNAMEISMVFENLAQATAED